MVRLVIALASGVARLATLATVPMAVRVTPMELVSVRGLTLAQFARTVVARVGHLAVLAASVRVRRLGTKPVHCVIRIVV